MNTVKILHCADVHIGALESFLKNKAESRRRETLLTFEKIVDICKTEQVQVLAIAGDLFDSNSIESSFVEAVFNKIAEIPETKVIFAAGNHDPLNHQSPFVKYRLPQNIFVLGTNETVLTFEDINLKVYGKAFETAFLQGVSSPEIIHHDDEYIHLLVQHGELFAGNNSNYNPISREFIEKSNMDYIALGHIHKKSDIEKIGKTYFAYCGCPEGQGFDELDEKGVYLGEIGKDICNMQFISTAKRKHIYEKIDISNVTAGEIGEYILATLKEKQGENFSDNLYNIELIGNQSSETEINIADLTARLNDRIYFVKIKDCTANEINLEALAKEKNLMGIFAKKMLEKLSTTDPEMQEKYTNALKLGLKAFSTEVNFDEN